MNSFIFCNIPIPGSCFYPNAARVPKGMRLWTKLKGSISRFSKKSEYKFDTSNLFLQPASAQLQDTTTVQTVLNRNITENK